MNPPPTKGLYRRSNSVTILQATHESPVLSHLTEVAAESQKMLRSFHGLIPTSLLDHMHAGPIDGDAWCILVDSNAVAAKLRQLVPALGAHLKTKNFSASSIRIKVQTKT
jgi:hypothetical protein